MTHHSLRHGHAQGGKTSPIYNSWARMLDRCTNPRNNRFHRYGGRGVAVCDRWSSFDLFLEDMGGSWFHGASIDRVDNDGGYCAENCRWATPSEQSNNRASTRLINVGDELMTIKRAAEVTGINRNTIATRVDRGHWVGIPPYTTRQPRIGAQQAF